MNSKDINDLREAFSDLVGSTDLEDLSTEIFPSMCAECVNNTICSPLTSHLNLLRIGIKIQVEACPYHRNMNDITR